MNIVILEVMKDPLTVHHLTILKQNFLNCTSCNRIEDNIEEKIHIIADTFLSYGLHMY